MRPDDGDTPAFTPSTGESGARSSDLRRVSAPSTAWGVETPARNDGVLAVLGPTNTGKTHYAVERMLGHRSGVIGFPLRLLAREIYDRIVAMRGPRDVALITGEEKIVPPDARYYCCTVESMPLDMHPDFVAIDEIQLCADPERGHVFTNRLLHARGRSETLFLGAATMWDRIAALAPGARFVTRERMSKLSYAGSKKLSRLPARSAIVGFSADNVYAIAELIKRQKGGAAVVMGALSPRTRNAQVELYQEGDVDYLVATDAIGMGLNMDVRHVAFAGLRKFDGRRHRYLEANELAQIAGRAGRHINDGTFGVTGEAPPLEDEIVTAIENHHFKPVERLQWRNARLDYGTPFNLLLSLERDSPSRDLQRARESDDLLALRHLSRIPEIIDIAQGRNRVKLLWDVCQVPDFRKTLPSEHAALLGELYRFLSSDAGVVPEDWIAAQCARLDREEGDIDALSKRLAYIRTWTYVANRGRWLADPGHWRGRTREIEDKLSDALHARLTQRFVDRRTSLLARRLKQKEALVATVDDAGAVTVEGEYVGKLEGFRFEPDPSAAGAEVKTLQAASAQALQSELARRVEKFYSAPDSEIDVTEQGGMMWGTAAVGRLEPPQDNAVDPLAVRAIAFTDDMVEQALKDKIERRLQFWIDRKLQAAFEPLIAMKNDETLNGLARGVAFQLLERYGVAPRQDIAEDVKALDQDARGLLRKHGVRFGQYSVFIPALLKPAPTRFRMLLWGLSAKLPEIPSAPPPGAVTIMAQDLGLSPEETATFYPMSGYRLCGPRALRLDMLERLADLIRGKDVRQGFEATPDMMSITGATLDQLAEILEGLGFRAEKGERPKQPKPLAAPSKRKGKKAAAAQVEGASTEGASGEATTGEGATPEADQSEAAPSASEQVASDAPQTEANETPQTPEVGQGEAEQIIPELVASSEAPQTEVNEAAQTPDTDETQVGAASEPVAGEAHDPVAPADTEPNQTEATTVEPQPAEEASSTTAEAAPQAEEALKEPEETKETTEAAAEAAEAPTGETIETEQNAAPQTEAEPQESGQEQNGEEKAGEEGPVELETFYTFRLLPRGRRARGETRGERDGERQSNRRGDGAGEARGRRPRRQNAQGGAPNGQQTPDASAPKGSQGEGGAATSSEGGRPPHRSQSQGQGDGGRRNANNRNEGGPKGRGKQGGKPTGKPGGKGGSQKPREYSSGGRKQQVDPDSPFAILQKLKDNS
ncbi:MAG: disulfide oxidoreductase [Rhodobacteraceae bacterium]|nr:disulfide oxidoreductase [Paracoccaceae bacterium]